MTQKTTCEVLLRLKRKIFTADLTARFALSSGGGGLVNNDNAEIHVSYGELEVFPNSESGRQDDALYHNSSAYRRWLRIEVRDRLFSLESDLGLHNAWRSHFLLRFSSDNDWYLGLNRIIRPSDSPHPSQGKQGEGVCKVCVKWYKDQTVRPTVPRDPNDRPDESGEETDGSESAATTQQRLCYQCVPLLVLNLAFSLKALWW